MTSILTSSLTNILKSDDGYILATILDPRFMLRWCRENESTDMEGKLHVLLYDKKKQVNITDHCTQKTHHTLSRWLEQNHATVSSMTPKKRMRYISWGSIKIAVTQ